MITTTYDETAWKLVPIEPTEEMIKAATKINWANGSGLVLTWAVAPAVYSAMLAAAKSPLEE